MVAQRQPERGGEVDVMEWYGNGSWPAGTTVHARLDGTSFDTCPVGIDSNWHRWRCTWNEAGMYFWQDYVEGMEPYFSVPANSWRTGRSTTRVMRCRPSSTSP